MTRNTTSRSLHDVGLAAWFGGTLANAIALNPAAGTASDARARAAVVNEGWNRWTPVNAAAIGAHLLGGAGQLLANRSRVQRQEGVPAMTVTKTALTGAALGATAWARALGRTIDSHGSVPVADGTTPTSATPPAVADAQKKLTALQWAIPALTGALVVVTSLAGEQQRPSEVSQGLLGRVLPS